MYVAGFLLFCQTVIVENVDEAAAESASNATDNGNGIDTNSKFEFCTAIYLPVLLPRLIIITAGSIFTV
jgi:hypothetical protein